MILFIVHRFANEDRLNPVFVLLPCLQCKFELLLLDTCNKYPGLQAIQFLKNYFPEMPYVVPFCSDSYVPLASPNVNSSCFTGQMPENYLENKQA